VLRSGRQHRADGNATVDVIENVPIDHAHVHEGGHVHVHVKDHGPDHVNVNVTFTITG
jgi:hypothetical protein